MVSHRRGFTLIEVLVTMTLLVGFGYLVFTLMRSSLEVWRTGETARDYEEKAAAVFDLMTRDLRTVHTEEAGRLFTGIVRQEEAWKEQPLQNTFRRLAFLREATRSEEDRVADRFQITSRAGLLESAWGTGDDPRVEDPALQSLYRGIRPAGGEPEESYFAPGFWDRSGVLGGELQEVTGGVLFFGLETSARGNTGRLPCWDSTRGDLPAKGGLPENRFPFYAGPDSLTDTRDDVFPETIRVTLVLERDVSEARLTFTGRKMDEEELEIEIDNPRRLPGKAPFFIKIDAEWMEVAGIRNKVLTLKQRGARGTAPASHEAKALVHVGRTFTTEVALRRHREDWNAAR